MRELRLNQMRKYIILLLIFSFPILLLAQTIPVINGITAENKPIKIPQDLKGKYSLLCFASSLKAQADLESWLDPIYQKFIAKTGLMDDAYDINLFFIPIVTTSNAAFANSMKKKLKENTQTDLLPNILFCQGNEEEILKQLNMLKSDIPHFILLDKNANIIYRTSGKYTEEKFDAIDELIEM